MLVIRNMTIKNKLTAIIMATSVVALLLVGSSFAIWQREVFLSSIAEALSTHAAIIADNCKAAVSFEDARDAEEILSALRVDSSIIFGCIYTNRGEIFASYFCDSNDATIALPAVEQEGRRFDKGFITVFKHIVLNGEILGTVCLRSDLSPMYAMLKNNVTVIIVVLCFAFFVAYLIAIILQKVISEPVLGLARMAKVVSENKDYSIRAVKKNNDEIGLLINAFNEMLEHIQQRDVTLVNTNTQLTREVIDREKAEKSLEFLNKELAIAVAELTVSNRELQDFAHVAAHDLKAPLRAIGSLASWISTDYADKFDEEGREKVRLLIGRTERMSRHIDSLLRYAEVVRVEKEVEIVDLNKTVDEIVDSLDLPQNISIMVDSPLPVIKRERARIIQIFQNLVTNAVKYMDKPEGIIRINCAEEDGFWKFSVADNGPGIEEIYFEKIFQIFQTLLPRDKCEGSGVGLAIVKKIVEKYGGSVWVESKPGEGSIFFFTLPKQESEVIENAQCKTNNAC